MMRTRRTILLRLVTTVVALSAGLASIPGMASAQQIDSSIAARLTPAQLRVYEAYRKARDGFEAQLDQYWRVVDTRRERRRAKHARRIAYTVADYVLEQPPKYTGPALPADIARIVTETAPAPEPEPLPGVDDFLAHAKKEFGFVPTLTTEREFKHRYAQEALAVGLTKEQVVRIYALETGGQGTYDMQSGISPITKRGRPISSALGYAQLLHANSVSELVKHGEGFARRLSLMAATRGIPADRAQSLADKATIVRRMLRVARTVPNEWSAHVRFANTPKGLGIHAINLDADIGPWLQVLKLRGLKDEAAAAGRPDLPGVEMELMNLAGPRTGLEMMTPLGRDKPTTNFFSRGGYGRNPIVRDRVASELLKALGERMDAGVKKPGAIEFAQVFDELLARR